MTLKQDEKKLESLKSQYRILISEIDDCVGKGQLIKRKELLEKVSKVAGKIRALEKPISETYVEQKFHKPDWVEIENEKHNLYLSKISLEERTTKELTEDKKKREMEFSPNKEFCDKSDVPLSEISKDLSETNLEKFHKPDWVEIENEKHNLYSKELTEVPTSEIKNSKSESILQKIEEKKNLIILTQKMSIAGGISNEDATKKIRRLNFGISNLKKELSELESEPKNIKYPSEESCKYGLSISNVIVLFFIICIIIILTLIFYRG